MRRRASDVVARTMWWAASVLVLGLVSAGPVLAEQAVAVEPVVSKAQAETRAQDEKTTAGGDAQRTVARLPANLARSAIGLFSTHNLRAATIGALATGTAFIVDDQVADAVFDSDTQGPFDVAGRPAVSGAVLAVLFVAGRYTGGPRFRAATYDWTAAGLVNVGYTFALKKAVGRERPSGADHNSFPSGHASNAFALAAVAERHYGWKVGVVAYGLAGAIGLSRLRHNAHYLSDVVAGATLGHIVGRTVVRVNGRATPDGKRRQVTMLPAVGPKTRGLVIQVTF
ncbi:MAG: phosphatase PAP2 family protein [Bacteroidales bacterium]